MNLPLDIVYQFIFFIDDIETLENFLTTNSIVGHSFKHNKKIKEYKFYLYCKKLYEIFGNLDYRILKSTINNLEYKIKNNLRIIYIKLYDAFQIYFKTTTFFTIKDLGDQINSMFVQDIDDILFHCKIKYYPLHIKFNSNYKENLVYIGGKNVNYGLLDAFHSNFCQLVRNE